MTSSVNSQLHLRVIGAFVEEHRMYATPRLEAVKALVLRAFAESSNGELSLTDLKDILCFESIPLIPEDVLRQALNALQRKDGSLELLDKGKRLYRLVAEVAASENKLPDLLDAAWSRHFEALPETTRQAFQRAVALLFARYGCAAYEALTNSAGTPETSLSEVVERVELSEGDRELFEECLIEFVVSHHPEDALLKAQLARTYLVMRMNGAGNWDADELGTFFEGRRFLIDTNVLFEVISRNISQMELLFSSISERGGVLLVGEETLKEFETAVRAKGKEVLDLVAKGVDLPPLLEHSVVSGDWVRALVHDRRRPTGEDVSVRLDALMNQVDGFLATAGVQRVHLERSPDGLTRLERIGCIKAAAKSVRQYEKKDDVARHDALMWESIVDDSNLADLVLTRDRSLLRLDVAPRIAIMLDEVTTRVLLGGVDERGLAEIINHALSRDLNPEGVFLDLEDVRTIARMELSLLNGPPRVLRMAARRIARIRRERLENGKELDDAAIGRMMTNAISSYRHDRAVAERQREKNSTLLREAEDLRLRLETTRARQEETERERAEAASESARLRADADERTRRETIRDRTEDERKKDEMRRQDWMSLAVVATVLSGAAVALDSKAAALGLIGMAAVIFGWLRIASKPPEVSLRLVSALIAVLGLGLGLVDKRHQIRSLVGKYLGAEIQQGAEGAADKGKDDAKKDDEGQGDDDEGK